MKERYIYVVVFFAAPFRNQPRKRFFLFSSLAAIFEVFTVDVIGCGLKHLYNLKVPDGAVYSGQRCIITREKVISKPHKPH